MILLDFPYDFPYDFPLEYYKLTDFHLFIIFILFYKFIKTEQGVGNIQWAEAAW